MGMRRNHQHCLAQRSRRARGRFPGVAGRSTMANIRICACCGQPFEPRSQVPNQTYCSMPICQRTRRQRWQHEKMQNDPDYRENQKRSQRAWHERHPDYWQQYRSTASDREARKKTHQKSQDSSNCGSLQANFLAGLYRIEPFLTGPGATMDVWIVQITPVYLDHRRKKDVCKHRT